VWFAINGNLNGNLNAAGWTRCSTVAWVQASEVGVVAENSL